MNLSGMTAAELAFLREARVARLATADRSGRPHVVPICFAVAGEAIYSPLDEKPKRVADEQLQRVRDVGANAAVCLLVDRYSEDWDQLAWLQLRAQADLIAPGEDGHEAAVYALRERYPQYRRMALELRPVLRLRAERVVSWRVNDYTERGKRGGAS
ncbi:MAG TPA: TIGR03668 family PPOX class F420-dependent oxidoreductase [Rhodanobacteraceae bacterium]|nr:TIGR03668 family PPOX class F420-dependent oxidoreductase [Rhodanobacteraceae bacterium]